MYVRYGTVKGRLICCANRITFTAVIILSPFTGLNDYIEEQLLQLKESLMRIANNAVQTKKIKRRPAANDDSQTSTSISGSVVAEDNWIELLDPAPPG